MRAGRFLLWVLLATGCSRQGPAPSQPIVVGATEVRLASEVRASAGPAYIAQIRADREMDLSFKVGGILEVAGPNRGEDWREGVAFRAGQVLARLVQADFSNTVNQARARAELDRKQFDRARKLLNDGVASRNEFDTAAASQQASDAAQRLAEQALADSTLLAAQDGTILARFVVAGETVGAGAPVLKIGDLRQMKVELGVPDTIVGRVKVGQAIRLTLPAMNDRTFTGRVSEVGVAAPEGTRLFKVVVMISNPDGAIKSGMTASVYFDEGSRAPAGAVVVPLSALITSAKPGAATQLAVFVVGADGKAHERLVKTDDLIASSVIVTEGLKPGERVVVAGASLLHDGAGVEVREGP